MWETGRWGRRIAVVGAAAALLLGLGVGQAFAATFSENDDAPSLPPGQRPGGGGDLTEISGTVGNGSDEDLYKICVLGDAFSATTAGGLSDPANDDSQLFLFNEDGTGMARGVVSNDDTPTTPDFDSTLPPGGTELTDGSTVSYPPGVYYLGISSFNNEPVDANGNLIFEDDSNEFNAPNPVAGPLADWNDDGGTGFDYTIALTGTTTVAESPFCNGDADTICAGDPPAGAIVGTEGNDVITPFANTAGGPTPTDADDVIFGLGGNDTIDGGGGNDIICDGEGAAVLQGGSGSDIADGDGGNDVVQGGSDGDIVRGGDGNDSVDGEGDGTQSDSNVTSGGEGTDTCDNPDGATSGDDSCEA